MPELWIPGTVVKRSDGKTIYLVVCRPYLVQRVNEWRIDLLSCQTGQVHRIYAGLLEPSDWIKVA